MLILREQFVCADAGGGDDVSNVYGDDGGGDSGDAATDDGSNDGGDGDDGDVDKGSVMMVVMMTVAATAPCQSCDPKSNDWRPIVHCSINNTNC